MPAKTLKKLATESCIHGIKYLYDVGEAPYRVVRPVLLRLGNPQQLKEIEQASPQLVAEDEEIWRMFIIRDIPNGESWLKQRDDDLKAEEEEKEGHDKSMRREEPRRHVNWWKIYQKLRRKAEEAVAVNAASLKASMNQKAAEKESNSMVFDSKLKIPKGSNRQPSSSTDSRKTQKSMSILEKARRDAQSATSNRKFVNTPFGMLKQSPGRTVFQSSHRPLMQQSSASTGLLKASTPPAQNKEEASQRRERALAEAKARSGAVPHQSPAPLKRPASGPSVFLPNKRRAG